MVFAGTNNNPLKLDHWLDMANNVLQGLGINNKQYHQALELTRAASEYVRSKGGKLKLAGHSLGGGLATASALVHGVEAHVIDPAGVNIKTVKRHGGDLSRADDLIHATRLHGEFLTSMQDSIGSSVMPDTTGQLMTIPQDRFRNHRPIGNHGSDLIVATMEKLLRSTNRD